MIDSMTKFHELFTEEKKIFEKVQDISDYRRLNSEERSEYDAALRRYRDYNVTLLTAQREGRAEVRAEGRAEGRAEERLAIAINLKNIGMDISTISKTTGLTIQEVEGL